MNSQVPVSLGTELEAIWEIRFSANGLSLPDLLPGILFKSFLGNHASLLRLPAADIPPAIARVDPVPPYTPRLRLEEGNIAVQVGERMLSLHCRRPYSGWLRFSADIHRLVEAVRETGLIKHLERLSLKYIHLIDPRDSGPDLLDLDLKIGGRDLTREPLQMRVEIQETPLLHIVQIVSPAEAAFPDANRKSKGVLLDIDTICRMSAGESWDAMSQRLDDLDASNRSLFAGMLRPEAVKSPEAEYEVK